MNKILEKVAALRAEGQTFALATVVGRRAPVSAHLGDRAIVFPDGRMDGFVGGACSREIVRTQAMQALRSRHSLLVSIRPDAGSDPTSGPEHVFVPMTCASEGAIDVYVEPFMPAARLIIVGATPVAEALARTAVTLDYEVVRVVDARDARDLEGRSDGIAIVPLERLETVVRERGGDVAAVVASQGHYDEDALEAVLRAGARYVGLVASRKRFANIRALLESNGVPDLDAVHCPAGLDLGARTAPEVALSILAEIVKAQPAESTVTATAEEAGATRSDRESRDTSSEATVTTAVDPVCSMEVEIGGARYTAEVAGMTYYFCCAQCRTRFVANPESFLSAS